MCVWKLHSSATAAGTHLEPYTPSEGRWRLRAVRRFNWHKTGTRVFHLSCLYLNSKNYYKSCVLYGWVRLGPPRVTESSFALSSLSYMVLCSSNVKWIPACYHAVSYSLCGTYWWVFHTPITQFFWVRTTITKSNIPAACWPQHPAAKSPPSVIWGETSPFS